MKIIIIVWFWIWKIINITTVDNFKFAYNVLFSTFIKLGVLIIFGHSVVLEDSQRVFVWMPMGMIDDEFFMNTLFLNYKCYVSYWTNGSTLSILTIL